MKFVRCKQCGTENDEEALFCDRCGEQFPEYESQRIAYEQESNQLAQQNQPVAVSSKIIINMVASIVILIGAVGIVLFNSSS